MGFGKLLFKEMLHTKTNFVIACAAVCAAATGVVGAFAILDIHDAETKTLLRIKEFTVLSMRNISTEW